MKKKDNKDLLFLPHIFNLFGLFSNLIALISLVILLFNSEGKTKKQTKMVLNWNFTLMIVGALMLLTSLYFGNTGGEDLSSLITFLIPLIIIGILIWILNLIFSIKGLINAKRGELYKYPLSIPFLK